MKEHDQPQLNTALQLIQLIDAVATAHDVYDHTCSALDVVDAIADYTIDKCPAQPATPKEICYGL